MSQRRWKKLAAKRKEYRGFPFSSIDGMIQCGAKNRELDTVTYDATENRLTKIASLVFATVIIAAMCYTSISALQGEHGLFRLFQIKALENRLLVELDGLEGKRAAIANKTRRLTVEHLDVELLDDQARKVLGLGRADEILIR